MIAALLAFLLEPAATSTGPTFADDVVSLQNGTYTEVAVVDGSANPARVVCPVEVQVIAAPVLADGDVVTLTPSPAAVEPFIARCTLRTADGFDGLWVVYAGP